MYARASLVFAIFSQCFMYGRIICSSCCIVGNAAVFSLHDVRCCFLSFSFDFSGLLSILMFSFIPYLSHAFLSSSKRALSVFIIATSGSNLGLYFSLFLRAMCSIIVPSVSISPAVSAANSCLLSAYSCIACLLLTAKGSAISGFIVAHNIHLYGVAPPCTGYLLIL